MIKFLTIDCPRCDILEEKLKAKNIEFERIDDRAFFEAEGINEFPLLEIEHGERLKYFDAVKYINNL